MSYYQTACNLKVGDKFIETGYGILYCTVKTAPVIDQSDQDASEPWNSVHFTATNDETGAEIHYSLNSKYDHYNPKIHTSWITHVRSDGSELILV